MTTNNNFRVKNGLETPIAKIGDITLSDNSGQLSAQVITPGGTQSFAKSAVYNALMDFNDSATPYELMSNTAFTVNGSGTFDSNHNAPFDNSGATYTYRSMSAASSNYIYLNSAVDFSGLNTSDWTIDLWMRIDSAGDSAGNQTFVNGSGFGQGPNNIWFGIDNGITSGSGTLRCGVGGANNNASTYNPPVDQWIHIGLVKSGTSFYYLCNGVTEAITGDPGLIFPTQLELFGGQRNAGWGAGNIANLRIANKALFPTGTYTLPTAADYTTTGNISVTTPTSSVDALNIPTYTAGTNITIANNVISSSIDQSLNTTDNVTFNRVNLASGDGLATRYIGYTNNTTQGTYFDLTSGQADINSDIIQFWSGQHGAHRATIDSSGFKIEAGNLIFPDNTTQSTAATQGGTGYTGSAGSNGIDGTNGTNGLDGATGYTGSAGSNGTDGAIGYTGSAGASGTIMPQLSTATSYTTVADDSGKHIYWNNASTGTVTISSNASVAYDIGTSIAIVNPVGSGALNIAVDTDVLVMAGVGNTGTRTLLAPGMATVLKIGTNTWMISGAGLT